jgi:hypothetical protein
MGDDLDTAVSVDGDAGICRAEIDADHVAGLGAARWRVKVGRRQV